MEPEQLFDSVMYSSDFKVTIVRHNSNMLTVEDNGLTVHLSFDDSEDRDLATLLMRHF